MWEGALSHQIPTTLGTNPVDGLTTIMSSWGDLVWNTTTLGKLVSITHALVHENQEQAALALADVKFATSLLGTKLGDCPVCLGTDSVYQLLEELVKDARVLEQQVKQLGSAKVESARHSKLKAAIGNTMVEHICPLVGLYQ
jgi:hypothetical protein